MTEQPPPAPAGPSGPPSGVGHPAPPPGAQPGFGPPPAAPPGAQPGYSAPPGAQPSDGAPRDPNTAPAPHAEAAQRAAEPPNPPPGVDKRGRPTHGRISAAWTGAVVAAILLIALIIFIAQNSGQVTVHFLGFHGRVSLALALLIAAVGSVLLVAVPGSLRIMQLRRNLRRTALQRTAEHR